MGQAQEEIDALLANVSQLAADAARALSAAAGRWVTPEMIEADVAAGAPANPDDTINLVRYAAWLVEQAVRPLGCSAVREEEAPSPDSNSRTVCEPEARMIDPRHLKAAQLVQLLNSWGEVISERQLYRHRARAGLRIGDGRTIDLLRYVAWLVHERHQPKPEPCAATWPVIRSARGLAAGVPDGRRLPADQVGPSDDASSIERGAGLW